MLYKTYTDFDMRVNAKTIFYIYVSKHKINKYFFAFERDQPIVEG